MDEEPRRWIDDPSVDAELRDDLARAADVSPSIDVGAGLSRLNEAMRGGGGGAAGGAGGAGGWIAGAIIAAAIGGGALTWGLLGRPAEDAPPPTPPAALEANEHGNVEPTSVETATVEAAIVEPTVEDVGAPATEAHARAPRGDSPPREAPATAPEVDAPRETARTRRPTPASAQIDPVREEMALLARARAALPSDPARALALAEEGRRRFPEGLFGEEREAIAILASNALGRTLQARGRGERFLRAHPSGPFSERVRRAIEAP